MTTTITISTSISGLTKKIKQCLAIVGKRAKDTSGNSLFSDITTSTKEDAVFVDLIRCAAESVVAELSDFVVELFYNDDAVIITIASSRWKKSVENEEERALLHSGLSNAIEQYLYNHAAGQYLSMIHPSTGEKYPPIYGSSFNGYCSTMIANIYRMAYQKKEPQKAPTYKAIKVEYQ